MFVFKPLDIKKKNIIIIKNKYILLHSINNFTFNKIIIEFELKNIELYLNKCFFNTKNNEKIIKQIINIENLILNNCLIKNPIFNIKKQLKKNLFFLKKINLQKKYFFNKKTFILKINNINYKNNNFFLNYNFIIHP